MVTTPRMEREITREMSSYSAGGVDAGLPGSGQDVQRMALAQRKKGTVGERGSKRVRE